MWSYLVLLLLTASFWLRFIAQEPSVMAYAWNRDFSSVYVGARAVASGQGSQLYDWRLQRALMDAAISPHHRQTMLLFIYPAYVAWFFSPLGRLTLSDAFLWWSAINLLLTAWTAKRLLDYSGGSRREQLALLVIFLFWTPLQLTLFQGQFGMAGALGVTQLMISLGSGKRWQAGFWLALGLLKPQLLLFPLLALAIWRCWKTLAAFAAASTIVFGLSFAKLGFWIPAYLRFLAEFNSMGPKASLYPRAMQNWLGLVSVLLGSDKSFFAHALLIALSIASFILLVWLCWRPARAAHGSASLDTCLPLNWLPRFGLAIVLGILVSPHLYLHDWILAAPALVALYRFSASLTARTPGEGLTTGRSLTWMIALTPIACFAVQFGLWPQWSHIQLVPCYMGALVVIAVTALRSIERVAFLQPRRPTV